MDNFDEHSKHFHLSSHDECNLRKFIGEQGKRLLTASLIMEEKRWRELNRILKYVSKMTNGDLKQWWKGYLDSYPLTEGIPKTPLYESIHFIKYLLNTDKLVGIHSLIARYELNKNIALSYDFSRDNDEVESDDIVKINPSFNLERFNCRISEIISGIKNKNLFDIRDLNIEYETEYIGFYKNKITHMATVSSISEKLVLVLNEISVKGKILQDLVNETDMNKDEFMRVIKVLNQSTIISIHKKIRDEHVYKTKCMSGCWHEL